MSLVFDISVRLTVPYTISSGGIRKQPLMVFPNHFPSSTLLNLFLFWFPFGVWYAFHASSNQMEANPGEYPHTSNPVWVRQLQLLMGRFI